MPVDCRGARTALTALATRLDGLGRRAVVQRARALGHLARAPQQHAARHRQRLHQLTRELPASARRVAGRGQERLDTHITVLQRSAGRARDAQAAARRRELERLALALAAHDPGRTLARGYAMVADRSGEPLGSAAHARQAGTSELRFHDGAVGATVHGEEQWR